jgi:hypothetical protein
LDNTSTADLSPGLGGSPILLPVSSRPSSARI